MSIHTDIKKLLAEGHAVYSHALGRVGRIMTVGDETKNPLPVVICHHSRTWSTPRRHRHIHSVTRFDRGDGVKLEWSEKHKAHVVINTFEELHRDR